tara:strand:- start:990 stop:1703 length:714 start_codon:yes stop_codon:yes gene_type:complete
MADETDGFFNAGYFLEFTHIPTSKKVKFKAFVTNFNDSYTSMWNSTEVYGRMDPIKTFQGTSRIISMDWDVVASSLEEAEANMKNCSLLLSMLYPTYEASADGTPAGAAAIKAAPLFRFKFMNLASKSTGQGLVGHLSGLNYSPDMEAGIFHWRKQGENAIIPQTIKLMCEFTVLHTHELGWASNNKEPRSPEGKKFPYGRELPGSAPVAKPAAASDATPDPKVVAAAERLTRRGTE